MRRQFGGRRYARNWAVRTLKDDIARYRETGQETEKPSLACAADAVEPGQGRRVRRC